MSRFDYGAYFGRIKDIERLVLHQNEVRWTESYAKPEHPVDVLLYLGCNVLQTAHLACEVVDVFRALGVNFHAVAGPQFCCGIVHHTQGDRGAASRLSESTLAKFESFGARQVVMWCPSCNLHFDEVLLQDSAPGFTTTHATAFLAARVAQLPLREALTARVALHSHLGRPQQALDAKAALTLLTAIPGVTVVGAVASPDLGYHCPSQTSEEARRRFVAIRQGLLRQARELGADTLVTIYHSCQREWCEMETDALAIRNYISLVAQATGCQHEDRFKAYKLLGEAAAIGRLACEESGSHGWDEAKTEHIAAKYFGVAPGTERFPTASSNG